MFIDDNLVSSWSYDAVVNCFVLTCVRLYWTVGKVVGVVVIQFLSGFVPINGVGWIHPIPFAILRSIQASVFKPSFLPLPLANFKSSLIVLTFSCHSLQDLGQMDNGVLIQDLARLWRIIAVPAPLVTPKLV